MMESLESWVLYELMCGDDLGVSLSVFDERAERIRRLAPVGPSDRVENRLQALRRAVEVKCRSNPVFETGLHLFEHSSR